MSHKRAKMLRRLMELDGVGADAIVGRPRAEPGPHVASDELDGTREQRRERKFHPKRHEQAMRDASVRLHRLHIARWNAIFSASRGGQA